MWSLLQRKTQVTIIALSPALSAGAGAGAFCAKAGKAQVDSMIALTNAARRLRKA